jgi:hypothetical protein
LLVSCAGSKGGRLRAGWHRHLKLLYHEYHDHRAPKAHEKSAELSSTGMSSVVDTSNSDCKVPVTTEDTVIIVTIWARPDMFLNRLLYCCVPSCPLSPKRPAPHRGTHPSWGCSVYNFNKSSGVGAICAASLRGTSLPPQPRWCQLRTRTFSSAPGTFLWPWER